MSPMGTYEVREEGWTFALSTLFYYEFSFEVPTVLRLHHLLLILITVPSWSPRSSPTFCSCRSICFADVDAPLALHCFLSHLASNRPVSSIVSAVKIYHEFSSFTSIPPIWGTIICHLNFYNSLLSGLCPYSCSCADHLWLCRVFFLK